MSKEGPVLRSLGGGGRAPDAHLPALNAIGVGLYALASLFSARQPERSKGWAQTMLPSLTQAQCMVTI